MLFHVPVVEFYGISLFQFEIYVISLLDFLILYYKVTANVERLALSTSRAGAFPSSLAYAEWTSAFSVTLRLLYP